MPAVRHQFMGGVASLSTSAHAALFQSMQTAVLWQSSLRGPLSKIIAKAVLRTRRAARGDNVSQVRFRHRIECRLQIRRHFDFNVIRTMAALDLDPAVLDVLRPQANDFAAP